ncbi:NAC domain-containing protein 83 [Mercurialis annua]|uniref:NAC domain-containing protein 83 n=1 Tax=Mercurialis annua TaxID=3986 RepID=UPI00215F5D7D|nr:NAC domain-containing protein 83 [Mercurialis annua]
MEKSNVVVNGGMRLPVGYRFHPTDEELVVHYLTRKVFGLPLPASVIPDLDVFQTHPSNFPGNLKEKRYFFSRKMGNESENRCKRGSGSGYWKPKGRGRPIISSFGNHIVGIRKTLIFCEGKRSDESKTRWIMHQYHLVGTIFSTPQVPKMRLGDWLVYRIFQKKNRPKKQGFIKSSKSSSTGEVIMNSSFMEVAMEDQISEIQASNSSPCSSGITEVSNSINNNGLDQEEISSSISFSF